MACTADLAVPFTVPIQPARAFPTTLRVGVVQENRHTDLRNRIIRAIPGVIGQDDTALRGWGVSGGEAYSGDGELTP